MWWRPQSHRNKPMQSVSTQRKTQQRRMLYPIKSVQKRIANVLNKKSRNSLMLSQGHKVSWSRPTNKR
ncbi:Uncharacterised protein [Vibrio cholerae]|nr:Uncharacterised protein [Vibrio cholerae]